MPDISLPITEIRTDGGTQARVRIDRDTVDRYAELLTDGHIFPAVRVYYDGEYYWLADGFHRVNAARQIGLMEFECDVQPGTRLDAIDFAGSPLPNGSHGLHEKKEDRMNRVVMIVNAHPDWSNYQIADHCRVPETTVRRYRSEPSAPMAQMENRTVTRGDSTYTMHTANIGQRASAPPDPNPYADAEHGSTLPEAAAIPATPMIPAPRPASTPSAVPPASTLSIDPVSDLICRAIQRARCPIDPRFITALEFVLTDAISSGILTLNIQKEERR